MITLQEVELVASLLQRAGVNPHEAYLGNMIMDKLRALAAGAELEKAGPQPNLNQTSTESQPKGT